jgi:hypothetical protein
MTDVVVDYDSHQSNSSNRFGQRQSSKNDLRRRRSFGPSAYQVGLAQATKPWNQVRQPLETADVALRKRICPFPESREQRIPVDARNLESFRVEQAAEAAERDDVSHRIMGLSHEASGSAARIPKKPERAGRRTMDVCDKHALRGQIAADTVQPFPPQVLASVKKKTKRGNDIERLFGGETHHVGDFKPHVPIRQAWFIGQTLRGDGQHFRREINALHRIEKLGAKQGNASLATGNIEHPASALSPTFLKKICQQRFFELLPLGGVVAGSISALVAAGSIIARMAGSVIRARQSRFLN